MTATASIAHPAEAIIRPSEQGLLVAWRQLVEAHAEQVARVRETEPSADFWGAGYAGSTVSLEDPGWQHEILVTLTRPDDTWLDIGAGFGGTMLPLCRHVRHVTALEPSPGMIVLLHERVRNHYFTREGSAKDRRLRELLIERSGIGDDRVHMPHPAGSHFAVISWPPPQIS